MASDGSLSQELYSISKDKKVAGALEKEKRALYDGIGVEVTVVLLIFIFIYFCYKSGSLLHCISLNIILRFYRCFSKHIKNISNFFLFHFYAVYCSWM